MAIQLENIVEYDYQTQTGDTGATSKNKINGNNTKVVEELSRIDSAKVEKTTKINNKPLSSDITLNKNDIGLNNVDNTSDVNKPVSNAQQTIFNTKTDKTTQVIAGNGLTGGGSLDANRTINVGNTDDSIVIASDGIKVDTQNSLTSTSPTKPLAANQGKVLDGKITQVGADLSTSVSDEKAMFPAIAYNKRVLADGGTVISKQSVIDGYKTMIDLLPNTDLLVCPEAGIKSRVSGIYSYVAKAYDMGVNGLDAIQNTEANQPYLSGNIAPNERKSFKSVKNDVRYLAITPISKTSTNKWSISFIINWEGSYDNLCDIFGNPNGTSFRIKSPGYIFSLYPESGATINGTKNNTLDCIGKNTIVTFTYDGNGNTQLWVNGIFGESFSNSSYSIAISRIFGGRSSSTYNFNGSIKYFQVLNKNLSKTEITNTYTYLRSQYPEIEGVNIGNQHWATSNYECVVTGNGTVIPEVQSASTSVAPELITNQADREFTSDTGWWYRVGGATIHDGVCTIYSSDGIASAYIARNSFTTIGKNYSFTYEVIAKRAGNFVIENTSTGDLVLDSTVGIHTITFKANNINFVLKRLSGATCDIDIDNVSVKEVGWSDLTTPAWCYYNNDPALGSVYGKLYNYYAVQEIAKNPPKGWRVPSSADFTQLSAYLGGDSVSGGKLKKEGLVYWNSPNTGATNESGFSAIPGGRRTKLGVFDLLLAYGQMYGSDGYIGIVTKDSNSISSLILPSSSYSEGHNIRLLRNSPVGEQIQNIKVDRFSTNIASGTANKDVSIPFGYEVRAINVKSAQALTNLQCVMYNYGGGTSQATLITGKSVAAGTEIKFSVNVDCPVQYQDPVLRFNATGNGGYGMDITIILNNIL